MQILWFTVLIYCSTMIIFIDDVINEIYILFAEIILIKYSEFQKSTNLKY